MAEQQEEEEQRRQEREQRRRARLCADNLSSSTQEEKQRLRTLCVNNFPSFMSQCGSTMKAWKLHCDLDTAWTVRFDNWKSSIPLAYDTAEFQTVVCQLTSARRHLISLSMGSDGRKLLEDVKERLEQLIVLLECLHEFQEKSDNCWRLDQVVAPYQKMLAGVISTLQEDARQPPPDYARSKRTAAIEKLVSHIFVLHHTQALKQELVKLMYDFNDPNSFVNVGGNALCAELARPDDQMLYEELCHREGCIALEENLVRNVMREVPALQFVLQNFKDARLEEHLKIDEMKAYLSENQDDIDDPEGSDKESDEQDAHEEEKDFNDILMKLKVLNFKDSLKEKGIDQVTMAQEVSESEFEEAAVDAGLPKLKAKALYKLCLSPQASRRPIKRRNVRASKLDGEPASHQVAVCWLQSSES